MYKSTTGRVNDPPKPFLWKIMAYWVAWLFTKSGELLSVIFMGKSREELWKASR